MSNILSKMTKADLTDVLTSNVPAFVVDWTPEAMAALDRDGFVERAEMIRNTESSVDGFLMLARSMTVWGAYARDMVGDGDRPYLNGDGLAAALGISKGYVSKARKIGRAYAEYGVEPGTELWSRITRFDLPKSVRDELGKSPLDADGQFLPASALKAVRERWASEIDTHLNPEVVAGEVLDVAEETPGETPDEGSSLGTEVGDLFARLVAIVALADKAGDVDVLQTVSEGAARLSTLSSEALAAAVATATA